MGALPKFHETFMPILEILSHGEILHHRDVIKQVEETYYSDLPQDVLEQKTKSGESLLRSRISRGKTYLKKGGFVHYPKRGQVQITEKGKEACKKKLNLKDVTTNFLEFYEPERSKNIQTDDLTDSSPQDLIDSGFAAIESQVKQELLEKLKNIDPYYFEKVILILLKKMGYGDFIETSKSGDGGIDGIINQDKLGLEKIYIQAKRYTDNKVREKDIRNFIGAMSGDTSKGVFVTTSSFDQSAVKKAHDAHHSIILIDGNKLSDLMYQYSVGVQVRDIYEIKEVDGDFFEEN
jgi:restriction system protein